MEQPWERTAPSRLNPVMTLVDPRFNDLAGMKFSASVNPASAERLFAGSGRPFAELLALAGERKPLPRFALPATLRARVTLESTPIESDNVAALLPGSDPALAREHVVLTAHLDHVGVGAAVNGDRIYNGAMDNASGIATLIEVARHLADDDAAAEAVHLVRGRHRRGAWPARLALLRRQPHRPEGQHRRQHQHGHVPAALRDEVGDGAGAGRVRSRRSRARGGDAGGPRRHPAIRSRSAIASRDPISTASSARACRHWP